MGAKNVMTIEAIVETFSKRLPKWKKKANIDWLRTVHASLNDGGVWVSPALGTVYTKRGDGFIKQGAKR